MKIMSSGESYPVPYTRTKIQLDDEKLIEMVRTNRALYDVDHCKYSDSFFREKLWREIGAELKQNPLFCKKRWCNIRDNYRKALRKMAARKGKERNIMKKYKYSGRLDFLECTVVEDRDSISESPLEIKDELCMDNNTEESEHFDTSSQTDTKIDTDDEEKCTQTQFAKRKSDDPTGSDISKIMKYIVEREEPDRITFERHPVDAFLTGIAPTLKSLSPYYLSLAKTQIYSIVQEYEMAMIMEKKNEKDQT